MYLLILCIFLDTFEVYIRCGLKNIYDSENKESHGFLTQISQILREGQDYLCCKFLIKEQRLTTKRLYR